MSLRKPKTHCLSCTSVMKRDGDMWRCLKNRNHTRSWNHVEPMQQ